MLQALIILSRRDCGTRHFYDVRNTQRLPLLKGFKSLVALPFHRRLHIATHFALEFTEDGEGGYLRVLPTNYGYLSSETSVGC